MKNRSLSISNSDILMRSFLIKSIKFVFTCLVAYYFIVFSYNSIDIRQRFKKINGHRLLILGDSQLQRLETDLVGDSTYNFASSGEFYLVTYHKLLRLIDQNPGKFNAVLLGISVHSFAPTYNRLMNVDFFDGQSSLERYFYFLPLSESWTFAHHEPSRLFKSIDKTTEWGGAFSSVRSNPDSSIINETLRSHYGIQKNEGRFCDEQSLYLKKIDSLCIAKQIRLVLVTCPYHQDYLSKVDSSYIVHYQTVLSSLRTKAHISFLDDRVRPEWMSDACHLNRSGSAVYSMRIKQALDSMNQTVYFP